MMKTAFFRFCSIADSFQGLHRWRKIPMQYIHIIPWKRCKCKHKTKKHCLAIDISDKRCCNGKESGNSIPTKRRKFHSMATHGEMTNAFGTERISRILLLLTYWVLADAFLLRHIFFQCASISSSHCCSILQNAGSVRGIDNAVSIDITVHRRSTGKI